MTAVADGIVLLGKRKDSSRQVLLVASFGAFLAFIDSTIVNVAFPSIQASFPKTSISDLSWVLNAYNVVFAAVLVAGGRFADLLGRRRAFAVGVFIFTFASALCATAGSVSALIAYRGVQAVGAALLVPASLAIVIEAFPGERRSHAVGLWGAAAAFAAGVGPPVGGALVGAGGWRWAFLVNIPLGIAALALSRKELVESRAPGRRKMPDLLGLGLLAAGLALMTTAIVKIPEWGFRSRGFELFTLAALLTFLAFGIQSKRHRSPAIDLELVRAPGFAVAAVLTVVAGMGFYAYLLTHILWLRYVWGYSVLGSGLAVMPGAVAATVVAGVAGRVADKHGGRLLVVPGALVWAASFLWYLDRVDLTPHFFGQWLPGQVLSGVGVGLTLPILASAALVGVPGGRYALASGLVSAARQLGGVLGIAILVVIIGTPTPATAATVFRHGWIFSALCFVVVACGATMLRRVAPKSEDGPGGPVRFMEEPLVLAPATSSEPVVRATPSEHSVRSVLADIPFFSDLGTDALTSLARVVKTVPLAAGADLFRIDDRADALYVVRTGRVEIIGRSGDVLAVAGPGHVLGELALLTGGTRAATVRGFRDSTLSRLSRASFDRVILTNAPAVSSLARALAVQVQSGLPLPTGNHAVDRPSVIAVAAADSEVAQSVADLLAASLRTEGRLVSRPRRTDANGLLALEEAHDHVVLSAGSVGRVTPWRDFCLRQADRVIFVTDGSTRSSKLPFLRGLDLIIVGGAADLTTQREGLTPETVALCRRDDLDAVIRRLARQYCGRSVGLVLSGGGARALAHVGVLAELQDAGIEVGRVTGASMGSFIGALFAMGLPLEEIDARCHEEYVRRNPVGGFRLPTISLSSGRAGHAMLHRSFGDLLIEQLPRTYASTSVDIYASELVIHDSGLVRDAVGASISLPGVFPPYEMGGRLLVDGGVLDNAPIGPLTVRDEGPIILVDAAGHGLRTSPGANGHTPRMPSLMENLMRSMTVASSQRAAAARNDVTITINPSAPGVGLLEFHQMDRLVDAGREATRAALCEFGHLLR